MPHSRQTYLEFDGLLDRSLSDEQFEADDEYNLFLLRALLPSVMARLVVTCPVGIGDDARDGGLSGATFIGEGMSSLERASATAFAKKVRSIPFRSNTASCVAVVN